MERAYHYFASSVMEWRTNEDICELIRIMDKLGKDEYTIWKVPLPANASYEIDGYKPVVNGIERVE